MRFQNKVNILHTVQSYLPEYHGMSEVVRQLSERLVKKGHRVVVATSRCAERSEKMINGVEIVDFDISGNITDGIRGDYDSYTRFIREQTFDVMTNFAAQQWASDLVFPNLPDIKAKKVFVPTGFSGLYFDRYQKYFQKMKIWLKQYDMNVFLAENYRDINFARECGVEHIIWIPNGAAEEEFLGTDTVDIRQKLGINPGTYMVLHVGEYSGIKGQVEAVKIFSDAHIQNAALVLVSNSFKQYKFGSYNFKKAMYSLLRKPKKMSKFEILEITRFRAVLKNKLNKKQIVFTSLDRSETIAAYRAANLFLFPSNIECSPIVLFESAASRTPFLSSDVGNAREIAQWTRSGIILPTWHDTTGWGLSHVDIPGSVKILENIYHDPITSAQMADAGFYAWQKQFTWEKITDSYENLYFELLK
jgi:L-malate glycosyltransferase